MLNSTVIWTCNCSVLAFSAIELTPDLFDNAFHGSEFLALALVSPLIISKHVFSNDYMEKWWWIDTFPPNLFQAVFLEFLLEEECTIRQVCVMDCK